MTHHTNSAVTTAVTLGIGGSAVTALLLLLRTLKRSRSPEICSKLSCRCGKIQGHIRAKREDSIRIHCYCEDCRVYARFIASLDTTSSRRPDATTIGQPHGDNRVVQVCKSAVTLHQGEHLLQLALKGPLPAPNGGVYMHRFYASCCAVPLFNTVSFLGFVGVFTDFLDDQQELFDGPVALFPEEALVTPIHPPIPPVTPLPFLWKLARYHLWRNAGPFDYDMKPVYWGGGGAGDADADNRSSSKKEA